MIPIRDDAPRFTTPWVNYFLLGMNVMVFLFELALGPETREQFLFQFGVVPAEIGNIALTTDHEAKYTTRPTSATAA